MGHKFGMADDPRVILVESGNRTCRAPGPRSFHNPFKDVALHFLAYPGTLAISYDAALNFIVSNKDVYASTVSARE